MAAIKTAPLQELPAVLENAKAAGRIPLLLDASKAKVDTFFQYSNGQLLEGKWLVKLQIDKKPEEEIKEYMRGKLVNAMKYGQVLAIAMTNTAANLAGYFDPAYFPQEVFTDQAAFLKEENFMKVTRKPDTADTAGLFIVHKDFQVLVTSHFAVEDATEFLADSLPLSSMDIIGIQSD